MFSNDLSRTAGLILLPLWLAACAVQDPVPVLDRSPPVEEPITLALEYPVVIDWLDLQQQVLAMPLAEVETELGAMSAVPDGGSELYYFGLLNQQVKEYIRWIAARDAFRQLRKEKGLDPEQRQLAGILERYNQSRINWFSRQIELLDRYQLMQRELDALDQEKAELEKKIQALTDLEAVISTRKEQ